MNVTCQDRERIFLEGSTEEWPALELHATNCPVCAEELRAWKALSVAAGELREHQNDPALWSRIEASLQEHDRAVANGVSFWDRLGIFRSLTLGWQTVVAGALVLLLAFGVGYVAITERGPAPSSDKLLKNSALAEVERTERDYINAIDKLSADAKPQLDSPASPLMASYREKLIVLDSAIDELLDQAGRNPSNAHLRHQLLAMYQEKQETLREVLEIKQ